MKAPQLAPGSLRDLAAGRIRVHDQPTIRAMARALVKATTGRTRRAKP